jgi:hypothetical protein
MAGPSSLAPASACSLGGACYATTCERGVSRFIPSTLPEIARELRVDAVVEGSAMQAGDRVRITEQLIDAETDRTRWAKSYERGLTDILTLQSEVTRAIADEIRVQVTPEEQDRLKPKGRVNPEAHVAYGRSRH